MASPSWPRLRLRNQPPREEGAEEEDWSGPPPISAPLMTTRRTSVGSA